MMCSLVLISCLALSDVKTDGEKVEEMVDIIELHSCFDFRGRVAFRQLIFYRWSSYHRRFQVIDTVVVTADSMLPKKSVSGLYRCRWKDDQGIRLVTGLTYRKTRSASDPEVKEREYLPTHLRSGLKRILASPGLQSFSINQSPAAIEHTVQSKPRETDGVRTSMLPPRPEPLLKF